jgi:hypothetical protein
MTAQPDVIDWLLDSDPAIRWQVMRDLQDAPETQWAAERAKIEHEGWGARLLSLQDDDGQWAGGAFVPRNFMPEDWQRLGQPWTATHFTLSLLREFGFDPASVRAKKTVAFIGMNSRWDHDGQRYWDGEVEECINGRTVADGAYFGVDVSAIVARLLGERLDDGGWNCERAAGSRRSSFHTTLNVLEGLLQFETATGGSPDVREARRGGEEYLLRRGLFRRRATGEVADAAFLSLHNPNRWRHNILRALDYFRSASMIGGNGRDARLADAIAHLRSKRLPDGRWQLDWTVPGPVWFPLDEGPGQPSKWITLRATRVLDWWEQGI